MMNVTFPAVKNIFDTLPIGYYLGRAINTILSETSDVSAFFPFEDKIIISYPTIAKALSESEISKSGIEIYDSDLEMVIRSLLYHEISHVILTSNYLLHDFNTAYHQILNIFEDERIECICRNIYMGTDFKRNLMILNGKVSKSTDPIIRFFNLVRFRVGEKIWLDRVNSIINKYSSISASSEVSQVNSYGADVINLFKDFISATASSDGSSDESSDGSSDSYSDDVTNTTEENFNEPTDPSNTNTTKNAPTKQSINMSDSNNSTTNSTEASSENTENNSTESTNDSDINNDKSNSNSGNSNKAANDVTKSSESSNEDKVDAFNKALDDLKKKLDENEMLNSNELKKKAAKVFNMYFDAALSVKVSSIIEEKLKQNKQNGSAINAYSGRLDPRSVARRDDYRWWTQRNRDGHIRQYSKVHFNLFIDNSGSFYYNDNAMNTFIQTLDRVSLQNPDFTFDVITINMKVEEWPDHHRRFCSNGGNKLLPSIANVIRKHQKPACNNYNIVLFDGDAHSDDEYGYSYYKGEEPFRYFDNENTIIITDHSNKPYLDRAKMHAANIRYCREYCTTFINVVCDLLSRVV